MDKFWEWFYKRSDFAKSIIIGLLAPVSAIFGGSIFFLLLEICHRVFH